MPKLPVSPIPAGWTLATVEGVVFRPSTSAGNPMLQVEVSLESGQLTDIFLVVTTDGHEIAEFIRILGFADVAHSMLRKKMVPAWDLDSMIGKQLKIYIPPQGGIIKDFARADETPWTPRHRAY